MCPVDSSLLEGNPPPGMNTQEFIHRGSTFMIYTPNEPCVSQGSCTDSLMSSWLEGLVLSRLARKAGKLGYIDGELFQSQTRSNPRMLLGFPSWSSLRALGLLDLSARQTDLRPEPPRRRALQSAEGAQPQSCFCFADLCRRNAWHS